MNWSSSSKIATMLIAKRLIYFVKHRSVSNYFPFNTQIIAKCFHDTPFVDLYQRTTGQPVSESFLLRLKKKHPTIDALSHDRLQCTLNILKKFDITALDACQDVHLFTMNPITMDNYGEILKECGFIKILPKHIIRYHTIVRSRTIARLKKEGLLREDLNMEKLLLDYFDQWPDNLKTMQNFTDVNTSILAVRISVLEKYLTWRLCVTPDEFIKYCRNYLPLKHKPMSDIQESLDLAEYELKFDKAGIRRNGFIISSDPINTKLIIENVESLGGLNIREAIRMEPAILKNNFNALLQIRSLLEEYNISNDAQRRCMRVYCMCPATVQERLEELKSLKEFQVLRTNPRVLSMVVHKMKMMKRLEKIQSARKQCFSLNHLVSSSKVFTNYISSFGNKVCGRDIAILICSSLQVQTDQKDWKSNQKDLMKYVLQQLRRHKFWLHSALNVIDENIKTLKNTFSDEDIINNCQLLLYPVKEIEQYLNYLIKIRSKEKNFEHGDIKLDAYYSNLKYDALSDNQIMSLILYEIEKKYHFSGDGIWARTDGVKLESHGS